MGSFFRDTLDKVGMHWMHGNRGLLVHIYRYRCIDDSLFLRYLLGSVTVVYAASIAKLIQPFVPRAFSWEGRDGGVTDGGVDLLGILGDQVTCVSSCRIQRLLPPETLALVCRCHRSRRRW